MFFTQDLKNKVAEILKQAQQKHLKIAAAESCTGGLVAALFTEIAGSSQVFERGFVTYSNEAKKQMLQVPEKLLEEFGAVSKEVAQAMALGAIKNSAADIAVAITGIAGPDGGSKEKPVGLVYIASATKTKILVRKYNFFGDRAEIRKCSLKASLLALEHML